jgi:hypothetical protein
VDPRVRTQGRGQTQPLAPSSATDELSVSSCSSPEAAT